jgi:hypothetical protein
MAREGQGHSGAGTPDADSRVFYVSGKGWYFQAREGLIGPAASRVLAQEYLELLRELSPVRRRVVWDAGLRRRVQELRRLVVRLERRLAGGETAVAEQQQLDRYRRLLLELAE